MGLSFWMGKNWTVVVLKRQWKIFLMVGRNPAEAPDAFDFFASEK
jgi:hypothetical protein